MGAVVGGSFQCLMGCACSKGIESDDHDGQLVKSGKSLKRLVTSSNRDEALVAEFNEISVNDGGRARLIPNSEDNVVTPTLNLLNGVEKKVEVVVDRTKSGGGHQRRATADLPNSNGVNEEKPSLRISDLPNGYGGEHVAAGWPSWLTAVAGEAVKGWLPRRADSFEKLHKVNPLALHHHFFSFAYLR